MIFATISLPWFLAPDFLAGTLQAAAGLGLLIFVHELGHFAVAKWCGVQCDKFMIGFDIGGYKLSRKWGETVYGIGILPLGGYVKMLGQDDDPSQIAEQMEKSQVEAGDNGVEVTGPGGQKYVVDPRSYLAKSVPQRMAIISAGVIMNVIFAFIFAFIAFGVGVPEMPCTVSQTVPGSPAWEADLRTGDHIQQIGEIKNPSFSQLTGQVMLANLDEGVPLVVERAGNDTPQMLTLKPERQNGKGVAKIGIMSPSSLRLDDALSTFPGSSAANVEDGFQGGDEIIRVNGTAVSNFRELNSIMVSQASSPMEVTVRRGGEVNSSDPGLPRTGGEELTFTVPPQKTRRFGIVNGMSQVVAVQQNSPAVAAGILPGDILLSVDGQSLTEDSTGDWDPLTFSNKMAVVASEGREIALTVQRGTGDDAETLELSIAPREVDWQEGVGDGGPISVPQLGIAFNLTIAVQSVVPGSPAAEAGLARGDQLVSATLTVPATADEEAESVPLAIAGTENWTQILNIIQQLPMDTKMELKFERDGKEQTATMMPYVNPSSDEYANDRGFRLTRLRALRVASSMSEQLQLGWASTKESLTMVYGFIQKLFEKQVPASALGGPVTIARAAFGTASDGMGSFLMFLTMLSANLAVVNFLPIPLLDGGHMVFLAYEGIFGRPAPERLVVALHLIGFAFIIGLMMFLVGLDLGLIPRNL